MIAFFGFMRSGEICVATDGTFDPERDLTASKYNIINYLNYRLTILTIRLTNLITKLTIPKL